MATGDNGDEIYDGKIINTDRLIQKFIDEQNDSASIALSLTSDFDTSFFGDALIVFVCFKIMCTLQVSST